MFQLGSRKRRPRDYREQTYASPFWIVRYPHRARFDACVRAVRSAGARRLLDYGAGDGQFLVRLGKTRGPDVDVVAYEPGHFASLIPRDVPGIRRPMRIVESLGEIRGERFDAIVCLAVLEHMPLPERQKFYRLCEQ